MTYKVAVKVYGTGEPTWSYNALRFASRKEAEAWIRNLRLARVDRWEILESKEPANYPL